MVSLQSVLQFASWLVQGWLVQVLLVVPPLYPMKILVSKQLTKLEEEVVAGLLQCTFEPA